MATVYILSISIGLPFSYTSCTLGVLFKSYLYLTPEINKNDPIKECGSPFTAYSNILYTTDPGNIFTITRSSMILVNFENFIGPSGNMTSFLIQPEFKNAISLS